MKKIIAVAGFIFLASNVYADATFDQMINNFNLMLQNSMNRGQQNTQQRANYDPLATKQNVHEQDLADLYYQNEYESAREAYEFTRGIKSDVRSRLSKNSRFVQALEQMQEERILRSEGTNNYIVAQQDAGRMADADQAMCDKEALKRVQRRQANSRSQASRICRQIDPGFDMAIIDEIARQDYAKIRDFSRGTLRTRFY